MLLLSLGPAVLVTLLQSAHRESTGPDLSWLLFGPALTENGRDDVENTNPINDITG
ncbi:hypothetical protein ABI_28690 [Asticcacaulis biprosthecium C19]|uniref:Uncharacterized protein n=1 Tax=Asticcacaulis biprosthecium C19 TaxID=715226 RepID=F4QML2_9CAUL|nr:hypothetical protein [Asticcacaulis biprosthecium]EGF91453.1 hypothetical protein ABI_28690 [Asticcacaulis biprosthecium C19]